MMSQADQTTTIVITELGNNNTAESTVESTAEPATSSTSGNIVQVTKRICRDKGKSGMGKAAKPTASAFSAVKMKRPKVNHNLITCYS